MTDSNLSHSNPNPSKPNLSNPSMYPPLAASLESIRPEMAALRPEQLLQISVDPIAAVSTARGAMPRILEHREALAKLADFEASIIDKLPIYASAALQANMLYLAASSPPEHFQQLVAEAAALREQLLADATALAKREFIDAGKLGDLKGTTGYRNTASDLLTLVVLIRANWVNISGRTAVTQAELDRAEFVGNQLVGDLGVRAQSPAAVAATALDRQLAYTVFVNAYDEIRRAMTYLRWREDDVDRLVPSLFAGRRRRATTDTEPTEETPEPKATPSTSSSDRTDADASPFGPKIPTAKVPTGMPGSDPFAS